MRKKQWLSLPSLPNSIDDPMEITSPDNGKYNCVAWALGQTVGFWWPKSDGVFDWPKDLPRIETRQNFIEFFKRHGFETCENGDFEKGFEKIALFEKNGKPEHVCRLLKKDVWTSKLGILEDVRHSIFAISGGFYGEVAVFLKRKI